MPSQLEVVRTYIDQDVKDGSTVVLDQIGITMSAYLRMALLALIEKRGLPFDATCQEREAAEVA